MELAFDLCTLALYDIAIYADDSTSMKFAEGELVRPRLSAFWVNALLHSSNTNPELHYSICYSGAASLSVLSMQPCHSSPHPVVVVSTCYLLCETLLQPKITALMDLTLFLC